MTFIIERGHDLNFVINLDLLAFEGLYESCERRDALEKIEQTELTCLALNDVKAMNERLKLYREKIVELAPQNDAAAFLSSKWGKGF